jgi:L-threonate 2-dehydrogenase
MKKSVGVIGLGIMGGAIAANLRERGWVVVGFDIDQAKRRDMAAAGIEAVGSIADAVKKADAIITSLPSPSALLVAANEISEADAANRIVIETSTMAIADKMRFAKTLGDAGHIALDCPLSGTGAQAKARDLIVYASGNSEAISAIAPIFKDFARRYADLGAFGNGSKMKFVANLLVAIHNVAAAEAMVVAKKAGLNLDQVIELVGSGAGGSRVFQLRAPMMAANHYEPATMRNATWLKDMAIIGAYSQELGVETPLFSTTAPLYEKAVDMGLGDQDTAAVCRVIEDLSGISK